MFSVVEELSRYLDHLDHQFITYKPFGVGFFLFFFIFFFCSLHGRVLMIANFTVS